MAKTLLNAVNEILKRVGVVSGDAGALTTLTDSARQKPIDVAVQVINEAIDELYTMPGLSAPQGQAESTITLATGDRSYALASDLVRLRFPLIDKTNNQYIYEYKNGYNELLKLDPEQDDTGRPLYGAISPVNGELHLERAPTSEDNGSVYTYQYDKDVSLSILTDTVPFSDAVFRAMVPAWVKLWERDVRNEFDAEMFRASLGRASRLLRQIVPKNTYNPRA